MDKILINTVSMFNNVPVADAKLILMECDWQEAMFYEHQTVPFEKEFMLFFPVHGKVNNNKGKYFKPLIISTVENPKAGDLVLNSVNNKISTVIADDIYMNEEIGRGEFRKSPWCTLSAALSYKHPKILALPEQFSEDDLKCIVEGKIRDKVLIECITFVSPDGVNGGSTEHVINIGGKKHPYVSLHPSTVQTLPEVVNSIAFDLFVNEIEKRSIKEQEVYEAFMYVRDYAIELSKHGSVKFENEPLKSTEKL
jgi:hypothetical protein